MAPLKDELLELLAPFKQEQLLRFWDTLDAGQRESLASEIRSIDFSLVAELYRQADSGAEMRALAARGTSPPAFVLRDPSNRISPEAARQEGIKALQAGRVGVMLVAGGQGTRLGFKHPKGMYPIGPVSGKSLFQIHFEKVRAAARRYGVRIPLYLMTSPETHEGTVAYLRAHECFGLSANDLCVFCQGTMPAVDDRAGKVLLADRHRVALSPDGHGGMLAAFARSGAMADARRRGVRHLFYFQVDNPLVSVCDPEFLGYHLLSRSRFTSQVVRKQDPMEKVGNVFAVNGELYVIEYIEFEKLDPEIRSKGAAEGTPVFWAGSIAVHAFDLAFLRRVAPKAESLPFHKAKKKVAHLDEQGNLIKPAEPNAQKFERFIFDLMPWAGRAATLVEVDRARHFAPLKNASGEPHDTPESVETQLSASHRAWLRGAGFAVDDDVPVEISPLFALDAEELAGRMLSKKPITQPTYFG